MHYLDLNHSIHYSSIQLNDPLNDFEDGEISLNQMEEGEVEDYNQKTDAKVEAIRSGYQEIVKEFTKRKSSKNTLQKIWNVLFEKNIFPQNLMQMIQEAADSEKNIYFPIKTQKETYYLGFDKKTQKVELLLLGELIGKGSFSKVFAIQNIFNCTQEVIKEASSTVKARKEVEHSYKLLTNLHSQGRLWGIQAPDRCIGYFKIDAKQISFGSITEKYDTDYMNHIKQEVSSYQERLTEMHQLLGGLKLLHESGHVHGDLKPDNVLLQLTQEVLNLADFGGARQVEPPIPIHTLKAYSRSFTPHYCSPNDFTWANKLAALGEYKELVELEKKRDVFSIGYILYMALENKEPFDKYTKDEFHFPVLSSFQPFKNKIPTDLKNLIQQMLHADYRKRPTSTEVFEKYKAFLEKNHSTELFQINQRIFKDYGGASFTLF